MALGSDDPVGALAGAGRVVLDGQDGGHQLRDGKIPCSAMQKLMVV